MAALLFVYGTLKRGQRSHFLLHDQVLLGEAQTVPRYRLYDAGPYPVLVEDPSHGRAVQGEVWQVTDAILECLDEWEGVPHLYVRRQIDLENTAGPVWAYFFTGEITAYPDCGGQWPPLK